MSKQNSFSPSKIQCHYPSKTNITVYAKSKIHSQQNPMSLSKQNSFEGVTNYRKDGLLQGRMCGTLCGEGGAKPDRMESLANPIRMSHKTRSDRFLGPHFLRDVSSDSTPKYFFGQKTLFFFVSCFFGGCSAQKVGRRPGDAGLGATPYKNKVTPDSLPKAVLC